MASFPSAKKPGISFEVRIPTSRTDPVTNNKLATSIASEYTSPSSSRVQTMQSSPPTTSKSIAHVLEPRAPKISTDLANAITAQTNTPLVKKHPLKTPLPLSSAIDLSQTATANTEASGPSLPSSKRPRGRPRGSVTVDRRGSTLPSDRRDPKPDRLPARRKPGEHNTTHHRDFPCSQFLHAHPGPCHTNQGDRLEIPSSLFNPVPLAAPLKDPTIRKVHDAVAASQPSPSRARATNASDDYVPILCGEDPRLFNGLEENVLKSLEQITENPRLDMNHSKNSYKCINTSAHLNKPHGVCER